MTNVRSDASNLERINRWKCALRMFEEKPFTGWGPGTYMFNYAPFQASYDRTIISTDFGDMGNAHSEYLGPLSESGLPGLFTITAVFILAFSTGARVYRRAVNPRDRIIVLSILTGLSSYFIHGLMNNFLDRDKAAIPFWGFLAILVTLDLYYQKKKEKTKA
jgi:O-antigen ligase